MNKKVKIILFLVLLAGAIGAAAFFLSTADIAVLNPKGEIASQQRDLIILATSLSAIVVIPVFVLLGVFAWRYREGNKKAAYHPNWDSNKLLETVWWGIPCLIILVLAAVTWQTSHDLDPFKPLNSQAKPLNVQVVALQWKWLFIYPDQKVASVNMLQFPIETPVKFTITADAPMNAFWIPHLGSQVYAMSGMSTKLHLIANEAGDYKGASSNVSGKGFANMAFTARASTSAEFDKWINDIKKSAQGLDQALYEELAKPGSTKTPAYYVLKGDDLYDSIVMKYMAPPSSNKHEADKSTTPRHDHSYMMSSPNMEEH